MSESEPTRIPHVVKVCLALDSALTGKYIKSIFSHRNFLETLMILPASVTAAFALFLSFVVASPIKESPVSYAGHKVVRFNVTNHDQYSTLLALKNEYHLDLWSSLRAGGLVDVRIEPDFLDLMMAKTGSIEKTVLIDDVQSLVDEEVKHSVAAHQDRAGTNVVMGRRFTRLSF